MAQGPGGGTFDDPGLQDVNFFGSVRDHCQVKATATDGQRTCSAQTDVVVIEVTDLFEDVPLQLMDEYLLQGTSGATYLVPFLGSFGELRSVRVAPPYDPDQPFAWHVDFDGQVDHQTGNVLLSFYRDGPYCIKTIQDSGGTLTEVLFQVCYNAPPGTTKNKKTPTGKTARIAAPSADLIMVDNSANDNGYLANIRAFFGAGGFQAIGSVADVIAKINARGNTAFTALLCAHGAPGYIGMGAGDLPVTPQQVGKCIDNTAVTQADRNNFTAACVPAVTRFTFAACDVGQDAAFLQSLATAGNMTAVAPNCHIYCSSDKKWYLDVGGQWVTKTP